MTMLSPNPLSVAHVQAVPFTNGELAELNAEFETAPASKIVRWAVETFGAHLSLAASMADALLIDIATKVDPAIEVIFMTMMVYLAMSLLTSALMNWFNAQIKLVER